MQVTDFWGGFFDQNDPVFSTASLKFLVIFEQVWTSILCMLLFKDKTEQRIRPNPSLRSNT